MPVSAKSQQPKVLDEVRQVLRVHHYSIHTERSYIDWTIRFIRFHHMHCREDLFPPEPKIEAFLTHLAIDKHVAPATQNQAMNALVFLYKRVLNQTMDGLIDAIRADRKVNVPVVMTREEVAAVLSLMNGTPQLVAKLLYGSDPSDDGPVHRASSAGAADAPQDHHPPAPRASAVHSAVHLGQAPRRPCPPGDVDRV
jgi:hypothetical protein